jgi:hypothetical protein
VNFIVKILGVLIIIQLGISCSFVSTTTDKQNYRIDYSSGGGFTGIESGITIKDDGSVKFWERRLNSSLKITDSTVLNSEQINTLHNLMKSKELFTYNNEYRGNYTAQLTFSNDSIKNNFSFNPSEFPKDMPYVIKNVIEKIKYISNHK